MLLTQYHVADTTPLVAINNGEFAAVKTGGTFNIEDQIGYGDNYDRLESRENTTKTTYLDYFDKGGAEFVYQWIHSDPHELYFNDNYSPNPANILTIEAIREADFNGKVSVLFGIF